MKHFGTEYIETERLILRRLVEADASAMYKNWTSDEEVTKFLMWQPHKDISVTEEILKEWISNYSKLDFLFNKVDVQRVELRYDPRNKNSGGVMKKCGMKYEGTLRKSDRNNKGISDASYYSLLKSDIEN